MSVVHINRPGPMRTVKTERSEPRWCFSCRKRLGGTWTLRAEIEPTYYDPIWVYACDGCGDDRRHFPGTAYS